MPAASASPVVRTARSMLMLYTVSRGIFVLQSLISYSSSFFLFLFFRFIFSLNRLACIYYYVVFDQPHRLKAVFYLMINLPHGAPMFHYPFLSVLFIIIILVFWTLAVWLEVFFFLFSFVVVYFRPVSPPMRKEEEKHRTRFDYHLRWTTDSWIIGAPHWIRISRKCSLTNQWPLHIRHRR